MLKSKVCDNTDITFAKKVYRYILIFSFVWLILIFLAPILPENFSSFLYLFFSKVCHQDPERSFHLFENSMGVCSRCTGIYLGFFAGTVFYPLKYKPDNFSPPGIWILFTAATILLADVFLDVFGIMQNTFFSRTVTGFFMGMALAYFIIPGFVKFFFEVNSFIRNKINA